MAEIEVSNLISVREAMAIIDATPVRSRIVAKGLLESVGLFLAEDLRSDRDAPPFDKSLMDGYAVRAADILTVPCELELVGTVTAGKSSAISVNAGEAMAIMTGAPLPSGADTVVPVEMTRQIGESNHIVISHTVPKGRNIARQGCDSAKDSVVAKSGSRIGPAQVAVAASVGAATVRVFDVPSIAVLGTGDELIAPNEVPTGSQIRSSNNVMLMALLRKYPCKAFELGIVRDDPAAIESQIKTALSHDILLVTGGMSMGERDYVPAILRKLGADLKITKLRIKPGKPFVFAEMPGGKYVFGLPGNPVSAFVCTVILASRLFLRMAGGTPETPHHAAPLTRELEGNGDREFYQPGIYDGRSIAPLKWIGSADIHTLARANALLIRPANQAALAAGSMVEFMPI